MCTHAAAHDLRMIACMATMCLERLYGSVVASGHSGHIYLLPHSLLPPRTLFTPFSHFSHPHHPPCTMLDHGFGGISSRAYCFCPCQCIRPSAWSHLQCCASTLFSSLSRLVLFLPTFMICCTVTLNTPALIGTRAAAHCMVQIRVITIL